MEPLIQIDVKQYNKTQIFVVFYLNLKSASLQFKLGIIFVKLLLLQR